jgi:hypothetical protein
MSEKDKIINRVKTDLLGPESKNEILKSYPTDVYLTGILFPPKSDISDEEADQLQAEGGRDIDSNDVSQDEISLASVKRPASAGISFVVSSHTIPAIHIEVEAGKYRLEKTNNEDGKSINQWHREAVQIYLPETQLDFISKDIPSKYTGVEGLGLHIRTSNWDDKILVTVAIINEHRLPDEYERSSYEEICFFQTAINIKAGLNTRFCDRPLGGSAMDEDTKMAKLIYRNVKEFAVGHTCSASWLEENGAVNAVSSTWLPTSIVKSMSSSGVEEFKILSAPESGPILGTDWLANNSGEVLISGLRQLPSLYNKWLEKEEKKKAGLSDELKEQAEKHLSNAANVCQRIHKAIDLIENNKDIEDAFRLANQAIYLQRKWADGEQLVWRPFQLGFFLLSLESVADENHPDREIADLLWFPTGGGKTEAYLGLIAFLLFLRRIRFGESGAGVSSFMRYTLRLLTVQQFQRAAAMICACDAIRQNSNVPQNITVNLTNIPYSLGLWVGGDTTPNKFKDAKIAMANESAHNRPDQLKFCPKHSKTLLNWKVDETVNEIHAFCGDTNCLWHKSPLPIWTVDENIYQHTPSLIIGTIDKFAQLARNKDTPRLFGLNTPFRQPDLIIQDELHLISGPLGTLTGIYEVAIDYLCTKNDCRPKIIASTATIRQASAQIKSLFNRDTCLFPPPVLDSKNSGFAVEDENDAGRQYLGLTTAGRSSKFALQALSASILQAVKSDDISDAVRDDFWTLVTYFNSLRELGGALVLIQDDVGNSLHDYATRHNEEPRKINEPMELTSRVSSSEIKNYLDQLKKPYSDPDSCDVLLASNMISVGVDVPRLGAMIVNGQPKGIAEYIQATSRVGRRPKGPGGLVVTIYNNAKSRDRSHYETFQTWHLALYREVEATSVTPFSPRARDKAIHAVLVILARHLIPELQTSVKNVKNFEDKLNEFIEYIVERTEEIDPEETLNVEDDLLEFLGNWMGNSSSYKQFWLDKYPNTSLLISAEKAAEKKARYGAYTGRAKPTPNSMRNVEPGTLYVLEEKLR